jgi:hypothetical protein
MSMVVAAPSSAQEGEVVEVEVGVVLLASLLLQV